jgi:hypothetical protein
VKERLRAFHALNSGHFYGFRLLFLSRKQKQPDFSGRFSILLEPQWLSPSYALAVARAFSRAFRRLL